LELVEMQGKLSAQRSWLVTGAAGFIGSHLVENLIKEGQRVVGIDNFSTGKRENIDYLKETAPSGRQGLFTFFEQDIRDREGLTELVQTHAPDVILHQAALGSVPRSIADPIASHQSNVDGFVHMLDAARLANVKRFVYASSSSVYGDITDSSKVESRIGSCLSPYAVTKRCNELYAQIFGRTYGMETVGLRYFNVFGPRQDPKGPYAAVIPRWLEAIRTGAQAVMYGDGTTSRDFCFVRNVVQANLLAGSVTKESAAINSVVNIACGATTSLKKLFQLLREEAARVKGIDVSRIPLPQEEPFRQGDILHSLADISFARESLGYEPTYTVEEGIGELVEWFLSQA
jgi:UDP-N-acetylglucosamine 4-epimerase